MWSWVERITPQLLLNLRLLPQILEAVIELRRKLSGMALDFARLESELAENTSVVQSAVTLLQQVAQEIRDNAANQAKVVEIADRLSANSDALANALVVGTPSEPGNGEGPQE